VGGQAVGLDRDLDLVRRRAGNIDTRHAGDALQSPLELAVDHVVGAGQVRLAGQTHPQHGLVGGRELEHEIALQVAGQLVADRIDALARLRRRDGDVALPVGELHEHLGAVRAGVGVDALDPGHGRQRFLDRAQDGALDFLRRGAGVGQLHEDERRGDLGEGLQRQPDRRDQADHEQRYEQHDRADRSPQAELGDGHARSVPAS
jgi:hypothetical protein